MSTRDQYIQISSLPKDVRTRVIEFLLQRRKKDEMPFMEKRPLGLMEGKNRMSDDFNEPLEDFKDYR